MLRCLPVALLAMILASAAARAEDDMNFCQGTTQHEIDMCCEGSTQYEMNMCEGHKFKMADREMTARYSKLMARLEPEGRASLRKARRAWESYRDNMCLFEAIGLGSARSMVFSGCLTKLTREHIKLLDYHLTCKEGDLSCKSW
ncbi:lysozyme inhibitor LprI family protein [Microvirga alba]|uniref:DUF1311 domain-containing protein n=1 Tax=Microvirga alba TaxID=2791025 RepID=A0A931FQQ9_9HYPH|nr:lysozyme inhibitor LprI family protein [Microvirga alba]MBF9232026.1 DUF1311 domain-containing protein [Microvirga alba]